MSKVPRTKVTCSHKVLVQNTKMWDMFCFDYLDWTEMQQLKKKKKKKFNGFMFQYFMYNYIVCTEILPFTE